MIINLIKRSENKTMVNNLINSKVNNSEVNGKKEELNKISERIALTAVGVIMSSLLVLSVAIPVIQIISL